MASWIFEPGHTEAEFRARHMMVTWVRGLFKDIHGRMELDWDSCLEATFEGEIDATGIWTGEPVRDAHLRSADFFDGEKHPKITFAGRFTERTGDTAFKGEVELTIRGVTRTVPLYVSYLGEWKTPFWEGDENKGDMRRRGVRLLPSEPPVALDACRGPRAKTLSQWRLDRSEPLRHRRPGHDVPPR